ncbi:phosphatidate cytidylyltransferase [Limnobacter humi]|uniref:Phosphatidate cytidylyltransferase n=1 Tax=Limnobacter humi TaxID=1778671 RepID=A0ABT1WG69_9BURK|nr:phosphatidate cytidylyltransferase [Limnobacter humi]MCQ8896031.1 phosphatidate cytidylyltransferase [Limnobacter humi]
MLKTRVITAVVLLILLIGILMYGGAFGWNAFITVVLLTALWEWGRLGHLTSTNAWVYSAVASAVCIMAYQALNLQVQSFPIMAAASVFWVLIAPWCLRQVSLGPVGHRWVFLPLGAVLIGAACVALILSKTQGVIFLLSVIAICFAADIFAYFFGKAFGKRKLAPRVSPGKSWEGAVGGACSVLVLGWLVVGFSDIWPVLNETWQVKALDRWHPVLFSLWLLVLSAFSVVGDLFESMLKRAAGMKDSSQLLPGHGGVLDRIDAQLPVMPLALLLVAQGLGSAA